MGFMLEIVTPDRNFSDEVDMVIVKGVKRN